MNSLVQLSNIKPCTNYLVSCRTYTSLAAYRPATATETVTLQVCHQEQIAS